MFQSCPSHSFSVQQFVPLNTGLEIQKSAAWREQQEMSEYNFFFHFHLSRETLGFPGGSDGKQSASNAED